MSERRNLIAKAAFEIARKEFRSLSTFGNLLTISGFHEEAKEVAEAMMILQNIGATMEEIQKGIQK